MFPSHLPPAFSSFSGKRGTEERNTLGGKRVRKNISGGKKVLLFLETKL